MISLEQDMEQSLRNALIFGDFLDKLSGDTGCARRSGLLRTGPKDVPALREPAAIANGSNDNGRGK